LWLKNIQILNFRNFSRLSLEFSPYINIFEGENSQGKTNLIEAIYCLGRGASFRTFEDQRLIKWNEDSFYLGGEGERRSNLLKYELSLARNSNKLRRVNSHRVSLKNTSYWLWMVVFSARDMRIVQGGPFHRRNFLDEIASFLYPDFSYLRFSFNKVLSQRNTLLRQLREKPKSCSREMTGWDSQFLKLGSELVYLRLKAIKKLASSLSNIYPHLKGSACSTHLIYSSSFLKEGLKDSLNLNKIKENFRQKLELIREKEIESGITLSGPHRDDFRIIVDGVDQRIFGSQGEQRMIAIGLRLAEIDLLRERNNEYPIVLIDDFPSDLDFQRTKFLLNLIKSKGQVFVATQDVKRLSQDFLKKGLIFRIKDGMVRLNEGK